VINSRIAEPAGWTNLHAFEPCDSAPTITNNLITGYTTLHTGITPVWADGLSISCNGSYVAGNNVIDATDVGIVLFSQGNGSGQNIIVENNTILAAGRSAYGGSVVCDATGGNFNVPCDGSVSRFNTLWTSEFQHFDIGISVGTYPWNPGTAIGGRAESNATPTSLFMRVKDGIVADGVLSTSVQSNNLSTIQVETGNGCPMDGAVSAHVSGGHASGSIQPYTDRMVHTATGGCVGHQ